MTEDEPTEEERAEAEALARVLDGESSARAPEDAFGAAALLRYVERDADLDEVQRERVLQALEDVPLSAAPTPERPAWLRWLVPLAAVGAAAAALFLTVELRAPQTSRAPSTLAAALPRPDASLLNAQAKLTEGEAALEGYRGPMRDYRVRLLKDLRRAYPVRVTHWMSTPPRRGWGRNPR